MYAGVSDGKDNYLGKIGVPFVIHGTVDRTVECSMPTSGRRKNVYRALLCIAF